MPFESIENSFNKDNLQKKDPELNSAEVLGDGMNWMEENIEKEIRETQKTGDVIREIVPISEELANNINNSEWADYPTMMERERFLGKKYGVSDLIELSPYIIEAIKDDPNAENKLIENVRENLKKIISPLDIDTEAENVVKEFLKTGNLEADTLKKTTALYSAFLKDAKIFKTKEGEYKTLKDFSQESYFGKSAKAPDIECVTGKEHDLYSKQFGEELGLKGEELAEFIKSRKDVQTYMLEHGEYINGQFIVQNKKIVFNQSANLNLGIVISAAIHEFGHDMVDKLSSSKRISLNSPTIDVISSKTINEGIAEDFAQYILKSLNKIYRNKGFDLLAVNRQASSLEAEDIPHKYGSSIVNAIRESSPENFQSKKISELLKVISGEIKIDKI